MEEAFRWSDGVERPSKSREEKPITNFKLQKTNLLFDSYSL